jgi:hypothetical protein
MKQGNEWIERMTDARIRELAKEHGKDLIAPGESVREAVLEEIARAGGKSDPGVLPFTLPAWVGFGMAALLAVLIGTGFFALFRTVGASRMYVSLASGVTAYSAAETRAPAKAGTRLDEGYSLYTDADSFLEFRDERRMIFMLEEESSIRIASVEAGGMSFFLEKGTFAAAPFDRTLKKLFTVKTPNAAIHFRGAIFIRYGNGKTVVSSLRTGAVVESSAGKRLLDHSHSVLINEDGSFGTEPASSYDSGSLLRTLERAWAMVITKDRAVLAITADLEDVDLLVDGQEVCRFNRSMSVLLPPGKHDISLERDGYTRFRKDVNLGSGTYEALDAVFKGKSNDEKSWTARAVYTYRNRENAGESAILGFAVSRNIVVAVTRSSCLFFSVNGTFIKEKVYGKSRRMFFDSVPLIFDNRLYVSANDRLLDIDLRSGDERVIDTPGMISDGFGIGLYKNLLYFPFPAGIYGFDPRSGVLDRSARYPANSPVTPLLTETGLYIASVVSQELLSYGYDRNTRHSYLMKAPALCEPILADGDIIAGDGSGMICRLTPGLEAVSSLALDSGVAALVPVANGRFIALSENGIMYIIFSLDLTIKQEIKIDTNPDSMLYSFKKPVLIGTSIFIGTNEGLILIVDTESGNTRDTLDLGRGAVSCSVYRAGDVLFTGTGRGDIFLLE